LGGLLPVKAGSKALLGSPLGAEINGTSALRSNEESDIFPKDSAFSRTKKAAHHGDPAFFGCIFIPA